MVAMQHLLVDGALVVGMRDPGDVTPGGAVWVEGGVVRALHGEAREKARQTEARGEVVERIDASGCWLLPGFVQAHVHLCQTLLRNGPDDLALLPWLTGHVWPGEAAHDAWTTEISARLGLAELLSGGTTAILDMGTVRHTDSIFRAAADLGVRVTTGNALMDDPATTPRYLTAPAEEALAEGERLRRTWHGLEDGRLRFAWCPRFAVSCTDALLRQVGRRAKEQGLIVHTHASESAGEIALVKRRTGRENVAYLDEVGISGPGTVLAHVIHTSPAERRLLADRATNVAHCPSSNLKLASGLCPVPEYLALGINVALGADGAPCNDRLDPFTEMRLAALLQKPRLGPGALSAWQVVRMATAGGAEALGLSDQVGTLQPGRRADMVLLDPDAGFSLPDTWRDDPYGPIVYSFERTQVAAVWVDGLLRFHRDTKPRSSLAPTPLEVREAAAALKGRRPR